MIIFDLIKGESRHFFKNISQIIKSRSDKNEKETLPFNYYIFFLYFINIFWINIYPINDNKRPLSLKTCKFKSTIKEYYSKKNKKKFIL